MRILVIFTGGTIGCGLPDENGVMRIGDGRYYLLEHFNKHSKNKNVYFDTQEPLKTLSENLTIEKWNIMVDALKNSDMEEYDGIIITHGTDTLAWSAALFDRLLLGIKKPVVFVSADYNLFDKRSNGHANFESAVDFIINSGQNGVYVIYRDKKGKTKVYPGSQIKQSIAFIDDYDNAFGKDFGYMENGDFTKCIHGGHSQSIIDDSDRTVLNRCRIPIYQIDELKGEVLLIRPYVGIRYDRISLDDVDAVIHETYHSFTACTEGGEDSPYSILHLQKKCKDAGIPLYVTPFDEKIAHGQGDRYETADSIIRSGIIPLSNISLESAYARILLELSMGV